MQATRIACFSLLALGVLSTQAQTGTPQTEEDLAKQTALLKAQQAYYDQMLQTAKSQQAATDASTAVQTAALTAATGLQNAQYTSDLALASALKGSGLSAATGKEGALTFAAAEKTMLALQRDSLEAIDTVSSSVCTDLQAKLPKNAAGVQAKVFLAPANYEALVQKSIVDIIQLTQLHNTAVTGIDDFKTAKMEVAGTALAGALVSAQYLAGGIQAITKLFRTDYNLSYTPTNRQGLFEQTLGMTCKGVIVGNVEGKLRLNAAKLLYAWLPDMARFSQLYDMWGERTSQRKTELTTKRTEVAALKPDSDKGKKEQAQTLKEIDSTLTALAAQTDILSKYKVVAAAIKAYLGAVGTGSVYESLVWGQQYLHKFGGLPADIPDLKLEELYRFSYTLSVQDTNIKSSSTFFADKIRYFATAEVYYSLVSPIGDPVSVGAISNSTLPKDFEVKQIKGADYAKIR